MLLHMGHYVRKLGPLWTHSAFPFEDAIGHLCEKSHGTHDIIHQVCNVHSFSGIQYGQIKQFPQWRRTTVTQ